MNVRERFKHEKFAQICLKSHDFRVTSMSGFITENKRGEYNSQRS